MKTQPSNANQLLPPSLWLTIFATLLLLFFSGTLYSQHVASQMNQTAQQISQDDAPSSIHLASIGAEAHNLQSALENYVNAPPEDNAQLLPPVIASRDKINAEFNAFSRLANLPEERADWQSLQEHINSLATAVDRVLVRASKVDIEGAQNILRTHVSPEVAKISSLASEVITINSQHSDKLSQELNALRKSANAIGTFLNILAALIPIFLLFYFFRFLHQRCLLQESQTLSLDEKAKSLDRLSKRVAQDILSPLSATGLALEAVRLKLAKSEELLHGLINEGIMGLNRARRTVEDLLDFSRAGEAPKPDSSAEVCSTINDVLKEFKTRAKNAQISLNTILPEGEFWVPCRRGVLAGILSNLLNNAIKDTTDAKVKKINVAVHPEGDQVRIDVVDTGPEIPEEIKDNVFQPYFGAPESKEPGPGLRLATVSKLVEAHSGKIGLKSSSGEGNTFWMELPRIPRPDNQ